jgi:hypothetical protein
MVERHRERRGRADLDVTVTPSATACCSVADGVRAGAVEMGWVEQLATPSAPTVIHLVRPDSILRAVLPCRCGMAL